MSLSAQAISPAITIVGGKPTTLSTDLAQHFGKQHANVLRDIRNLLPQLPNGGVLNFEEAPFTDEQNGQTYPAYRLTRDGFTLLAMGFTGKKALVFKLAYIDAFNRMEAALHQPAGTQRMELAFSLAAEAAAQVHRTVFNAVMQGDTDEWQHSRYLLNLNYDSQGRATQEHIAANCGHIRPVACGRRGALAGGLSGLAFGCCHKSSSGFEIPNSNRVRRLPPFH